MLHDTEGHGIAATTAQNGRPHEQYFVRRVSAPHGDPSSWCTFQTQKHLAWQPQSLARQPQSLARQPQSLLVHICTHKKEMIPRAVGDGIKTLGL